MILTNVAALDDSASVRKTLEYGCLRVGGLDMRTYSKLADALSGIKAFPPDVVWCDIGLAGEESGLDLLEDAPAAAAAVVCSGLNVPDGFAPKRFWKYLPKGKYAGKFCANFLKMMHLAALYLADLRDGQDCRKSRTRFIGYVPAHLDVQGMLALIAFFERERNASRKDAGLILSGKL